MATDPIRESAPRPRLPILLGSLLAMSIGFPGHSPAQNAPANASPPAASSQTDALLVDASQLLADGYYEGAIRETSVAIQLDPHNPAAYEARGSIYIQERLWDRAERDYATAEKLHPDIAYQYKLAEIKFLQGAYYDAKSRFVAMKNDPRLGDLALYKAFLCDLLNDREVVAQQDLHAMAQGPKTPSYYYSNGAWDLYHNNRPGASKYFEAASQLFGNSTGDLYIGSLLETQRLRLDKVTFTARNGKTYSDASLFLESAGLRVRGPDGWITLPLDQLPDDLAAFPENLREQIVRKRAALAVTQAPTTQVSFTTVSGKSYNHVDWALEDAGVSVLTADGWVSVPFAQLPSDLSCFPPDLQATIQQKRVAAPAPPALWNLLTFTTKSGKIYTQARSLLVADGISVLTPDGWITVAYADLPDDLSAFPDSWRSQIVSRHQEPVNDPSGMKIVTFTTKRGKHYDHVRSAIETNGLRLLTSDGLIAVPFDQLPEDLSVFPEAWRSTISVMQARLAQSKSSSH